MVQVAHIDFSSYRRSVSQALDDVGAPSVVPKTGLIILKPNLTNSSPPPVTTPVAFVEAVYLYLRDKTDAKIIIGEGCGSGRTHEVFRSLGYVHLSRKYGIDLVDFNTADTVLLSHPKAVRLKTFHMPRICEHAFIVSLPVLKDHSFTGTTIAMKNMFGIAPAAYYSGNWNKSALHSPSADINVVDICLYKKPGLSVVDGVTALTGMHLSGIPKKINTILAALDPVALDARGSELLGHDPGSLEYLVLAERAGLGVIADCEATAFPS